VKIVNPLFLFRRVYGAAKQEKGGLVGGLAIPGRQALRSFSLTYFRAAPFGPQDVDREALRPEIGVAESLGRD